MRLRAGRGTLGDGGGDGFVGGVGLRREGDGPAARDGGGHPDLGDGVGAEAAGGPTVAAFLPGAQEEAPGAGVRAEAVGMDDAPGAV